MSISVHRTGRRRLPEGLGAQKSLMPLSIFMLGNVALRLSYRLMGRAPRPESIAVLLIVPASDGIEPEIAFLASLLEMGAQALVGHVGQVRSSRSTIDW